MQRTHCLLFLTASVSCGLLGGAMACAPHASDQTPSHVQAAGAPNGSGAPPLTAAEPASQPAAAATVKMTDDMTFSPANVSIPAGGTVVWVNPSGDSHTVTADPTRASDPKDVALPQGARPFDSGKVPPGGSYHYTFTVPGTYRYVCLPHEDMGMKGQVVVEPSR